MKKYSWLLLALLPLFLLSCKKDAAMPGDNAVAHIPADAAQVSVIRIPQLMEKLNFEEVREMNFYKQMIMEANNNNPLGGQILQNPEESGINLKQNAYSVSIMNPDNPNDVLTAAVFNMGDRGKFNKLIEAANMGISAKDGEGYRYSVNTTSFVAWNDDIAVVGPNVGGDPTTHLNRIFNMEEGQSAMASGSFEDIATSKGDFNFQFNSDAAAASVKRNLQANLALGMAGLSADDLRGHLLNGSMSFEEQKMVLDLDFLLKEKLGNDINMMLKPKVSTDFSPYIPNKKLSAVFTLGIDVKGINQLLKEKGLAGFAEQSTGMGQAGITPDKIAKAIKGDIMLAIQAGDNNDPTMIMGMAIDEKEFQPLLDMMVKMRAVTSTGNGIYTVNGDNLADNTTRMISPTAPAEAKMTIKDGILFFTTSTDLLNAVSNGGLPKGDRIDKSLYKSISGGSIGGRVFPDDLQGAGLPTQNADLQSILLTSEKGKARLEVKSDKEGNFLRSMMDMME